MAQTLDEFLAEAQKNLKDFEKDWRIKHAQYPEEYPLEMLDGNEGLWWEFLSTYAGDVDEPTK